MKNIKIAILLLTLLFSQKGLSQDVAFSQPAIFMNYINPAYIGLRGGLQVSTLAHANRVGQTDNYIGNYIIVEQAFNHNSKRINFSGMALEASTEALSALLLKRNSFGISFAGNVRIADNAVLAGGISGKYYSEVLDKAGLVFGDQIDPYYGQVLASSAAYDNYGFEGTGKAMDISGGIYLLWNLNKSSGKWYSDRILELGAAVHHKTFNGSYTGVFEQGGGIATPDMPYKSSIWASYYQPLLFSGPQIVVAVQPYMLLEHQLGLLSQQDLGEMQNTQVGANVSWSGLSVGYSYRTVHNASVTESTNIFHFGMVLPMDNKSRYRVGINYSYLVPSVRQNSMHEIAITFSLNNTKDGDRSEGGLKYKDLRAPGCACLQPNKGVVEKPKRPGKGRKNYYVRPNRSK